MSELSRRDFLKAGAAGTGLVLAVSLAGCGDETAPDSGGAALAPDAWVRIGTDGVVTVMVDRSEMGQGVATALPMLVAEELDADWSRVRYVFAPANEAYYNALGPGQLTGGSTSIRNAWEPLREAGAKARHLLVAAASARWGVAADQCRTEKGRVLHPDGATGLDYGELATQAASLPVPDRVALKRREEWRLIGTPVPRLDGTEKVNGRAVFGIDAAPSGGGVLVAVVARCPVFGGSVRTYDGSAALRVPGVRQVVRISSGIAVVADGYWAATRGREALRIEWDEGPLAALDDAEVRRQLRALAAAEGRGARKEGEGAAALAGAAKRIEAEYELPYLAHATMEPMNCTAAVRDGRATIWVPTQFQAAPRFLGGGARGAAAKAAGVSADRVEVITTHLGGGFGRRAEMDVIVEACETAREAQATVKVIWSREDDIRHDLYRPAGLHLLRGGLDQAGSPVAWTHRVVCPSIIARFLPGWLPDWVTRLGGPLKGGVDSAAVEGAKELAYRFPNIEVTYTRADLGVPVGFWRSVGHSQNAFAVESFVDELAHLAGRDPVEFRRGLLPDRPRHLGVLNLAAEKSGWGSPLPAGRGRGIAVHQSFGSWVAQVAEVSVEAGRVRVHRVVCAVDCGTVVNPDTVVAQMESGIVFGLTAALKGRVRLERGRIRESNFHDYPILRMDEMPVIETHIVPSIWEPGGVGEPGTPPIAPAVCNAVFAATGVRVRRLPIELPP